MASVWMDAQAANRAWEQGDYAEAALHAAAAARRWPLLSGPLWAQAGQAYALDGQLSQAEAAFQRAARADALQSADWLTWGQVRWQQGDQSGAISVWEQARQAGAADARVLAALATAYANLSDPAEAQVLTDLLRLDDDLGWAHFRLALWLAADGQAAALPHLRRAAALNADWAEDAEYLRLALNTALSDADAGQAALTAGRALGALGAWPQAARAFQRAVNLDPQNGEYWAWLAEAQQHIGEPPEEALLRAMDLAPDSPLVLGIWGLSESRQGDWALALDLLEESVARAPDDAAWWPLLGEARARNGDIWAAQDAYRRAAALTPEQPQNWYLLAQFCLEYNMNLDGEGLDAALRAWLLDKKQPHYAVLVGRYYMALNRPDDAFKYLQQARALAPSDSQVELYWGIWQAQYGTPAAARAALTQALAQGDQTIRAQAQYWLEYLP